MYLCYIDESGNTGTNLKDVHQPYLVLAGLLVPPKHVRAIENDMRDLSYGHFGAESRNTDFELHGDAIYNKRGKYFKKLTVDKRIALFDSIIDVFHKHDQVYLGYVSVDKARYFGKLHIQQTAFSLLVEKLEERLKGHLDAHCLLVADEQDELEQKLIDDLDRFKQSGTDFGYNRVQVDRIIDSVHFVQSNNNYLMQMTDVLCYIIRRGKEAGQKLGVEYLSEKNGTFQQFVDAHPHKGLKYFYRAYRHLNKKPWLFTKDFPQ